MLGGISAEAELTRRWPCGLAAAEEIQERKEWQDRAVAIRLQVLHSLVGGANPLEHSGLPCADRSTLKGFCG